MTQNTTFFQRALQQAMQDPLDAFISVVDANDIQPRETSGELAGIPYAVKDNIDTVALPTSANTPALVGTTREVDHAAVARLDDA